MTIFCTSISSRTPWGSYCSLRLAASSSISAIVSGFAPSTNPVWAKQNRLTELHRLSTFELAQLQSKIRSKLAS